MKWKDLSLKERKQIYDSVRANNPDATYLDIKQQFDSIPEYEDGKAGYTPEERAWVARRTVELGMEGKPAPQDSLYTIVDRAKVQNKPKKYDPTDSAIEQGKQVLSGLNKTVGTALTGASLATMGLWNAARLLNVGRAIEGTDVYTAESYAEPFTPTITKKKGKKVKTEADYDQEFAEVKRKYNNMQEYEKELSKITNDLFVFNDGSIETLEKVDKAYGTNYKKAASAIAFQDMANRGKYVKHQQMYDSAGNPIYGRTTGKVDQPTIENMTISLNPDYYLEGTANHEISHLADALVNKAHSADATNNYMEYLLDRDNIMSYNEIRQSLMDVNPNTYRYLTTPSENKAHMIQLKRGMQKEGLINNWTDPITQDKIEEYLSYRSKYANRVNPVLRTLYDIRPDKQGFINRMNNLTPIEWAVPLGLPVFFGEEQENK